MGIVELYSDPPPVIGKTVGVAGPGGAKGGTGEKIPLGCTVTKSPGEPVTVKDQLINSTAGGGTGKNAIPLKNGGAPPNGSKNPEPPKFVVPGKRVGTPSEVSALPPVIGVSVTNSSDGVAGGPDPKDARGPAAADGAETVAVSPGKAQLRSSPTPSNANGEGISGSATT
jgi:hypothetical protein